jgi:hypothetical protein
MFYRIEFWIGWYPLDGSDPTNSGDIRVYSGETQKYIYTIYQWPFCPGPP